MFSKPEIDYIKSQRLLRIGTVNDKGQPDVVPVGYEYDGKHFWVGGHDQNIFFRSIKYLNVHKGHKQVCLVIDDLETITPWHPRMVKVYGEAEVLDHDGIFGPGKYLKITPKVSWSFGLQGLEIRQGEFRVKTLHKD